ADSTRVDVLDSDDDRWGEDSTKADLEDFDEQTLFEGIDAQAELVAKRDFGVVVTPASHPGNGVVITKSRSPSMMKPPEPSLHTVEEVEIPTKEEARALYDLEASEPPEVDPAEIVLLNNRSTHENSPQISG